MIRLPRGGAAMWLRLALALGVVLGAARVNAAEAPLALEGTVALEATRGRIDHMAVDLARQRLFVAELGNGTVDVIDVPGRRVMARIAGLREPQGVGYAKQADVLAVASAGDGTVRFYRGEDFAALGMVALGSDADNIRVDPASGNLLVGYGRGGLAIIDPARRVRVGDIPLPAHPEGFQVDASGKLAFVNLPDAGQVGVADLAAGRLAQSWPTSGARANFPMALIPTQRVVAVVFRAPPELALFSAESGKVVARSAACGDADDVFFDPRRQRLYVSCGAGEVDSWRWDGTGFRRMPPTPTESGARTALFVPEWDRLFVAARAGVMGSRASIRVYRPVD